MTAAEGDLFVFAYIVGGPVVFAYAVVAIGCVVRRIRQRKRRPNRLERQLALAALEDAMGRVYDIRGDREAS